jgi:magnesium transporter
VRIPTRSREGLRPGHRNAPGTAPGTIVAPEGAQPTTIDVIAWGPTGDVIAEGRVEPTRVHELHVSGPGMVWVNVEGLDDVARLRELAAEFGMHPLVLEDVVSVHQRPKAESWDERRFLVARMSSQLPTQLTEQVSMFFGPGFLLSFQEGFEGDVFDLVRRRIITGDDNLRTLGSDYLGYALIDAVVDGYFPVLESYGERLEELEEQILFFADKSQVREVHVLKRELLAVRRAVWPLREAVNAMLRDEGEIIGPETHRHLLDTYDHVIQVIDLLETYRELGSGLIDLYLSSVSNRMNDIMKVLTIISTIFIPLTFIVGVYGMNFDTQSKWNMPELRWHYGYPLVWVLMLVVVVVQILFFRHLGWIGGGGAEGRDRGRTGPSS